MKILISGSKGQKYYPARDAGIEIGDLIMEANGQPVKSVNDLEDVLKLSQSNASRHLTKLRHCRLIVAEKQAQWVYYRINETLLAEQPFVRAILEQELGKGAKYQQDLSKLRQYRNQGGGCGCTEKSP